MFSTFQSPSHSTRNIGSPTFPRRKCSTLDAQLVPCTSSLRVRSVREDSQRKVGTNDSNASIIYPESANIGTWPSFIRVSGKLASVSSKAGTDSARLNEAERFQSKTVRKSCAANLISGGDAPNLEELVAKGSWNHLGDIILGGDLSFIDHGSQRKFNVTRTSRNFPAAPQSSHVSFVHGVEPHESWIHTSGTVVTATKTPSDGDNCKVSSGSNRNRFRSSPNEWQSEAKVKLSLERGKDSSTRSLEKVDFREVRDVSRRPSTATVIANNPDEARSSSRVRRSPLRQIFDPSWKSSSVSYISDDRDLPRTSSSSRGRLRPLPQIFDPLSKSLSLVPPLSDNTDAADIRSISRGRRSPLRRMFDPPRKSSSSVCSIPDNPGVAEARSKSRGRRSPLRQLFDPSRKSSSSICSISDNPDVAGSRSRSREKRSPSPQLLDPPLKSNSFSSAQQAPESCAGFDVVTLQNLVLAQSTRQALLKLSWENGLPVLIFSSSDENILMATMHMKGNSDMNICDCTYVIHAAVPVKVKRKNGVWLSHKKLQFASKFVAEMIVSSSERVNFDLSRRSVIREFVLLGGELTPSNRLDTSSDLSSAELAAVVIQSSSCKSDSSSFSVLCECNLCRYSAITRPSEDHWRNNQKPEIFGIPHIVAILPRGVHGCSDTEEPSKLIERWESGGSCDCGGWDEGCGLTILTNSSQELRTSHEVRDCSAAEGTCGFELFTEGDVRREKNSLSMVAFKEDLLTVEFKASIPLLQAFAISIAMLHERNLNDGESVGHAEDIHSYEDQSFYSYSWISP